ncbi:MAG: M14 family zinc carboxypeptidase [Acidobacteriaceae bacterium]
MLTRPLIILAAALLSLPALAQAPAQSNCTVSANPDYDRQISENTTDKSFQTELTDHLPLSSCVPAPDAFLHHIVGAPNVLDYTKDINAYMRLLAGKSPRVKVFSMGKSEEGREMILVAVSDEANMVPAKLDRYREITAKLADPRQLTEKDAAALIAEGKPIYWADGSIHSPETGSPEMLMELAYRLATEESPFIQKIRKDSIVLITPIVETDGHDRFVDIYKHHVDNPGAAQYPLTWWGHYVSHDNNRDGMTMTLALSRNMMKTFLGWHATVLHDLHESVPYLYIMTGTGPYNAWQDPISISEFQSMAYYEIEQLTKRGVIGVWTHGFYDGWAPNYMLYVASGHNAIGRFYETFSNDGADTRERTLPPSATSREWYRPNPPLTKVKWSARNNINMQQSALLFGMYNVASNGPEFLRNFYLKSKRSVEKGRREGPAAWVFPADDTRPAEQARLLNLLKIQGIEVSRLDKDTHVLPERQFPNAASAKPTTELTVAAGSYIVRMDQPYSRLADMMLDTQYYNPKDPRSYDDTGWTMGALYNVKTTRVLDTSILSAPMHKVEGDVTVAAKTSGTGRTLLINHTTENTLATLRFRLAKMPMEAAEQPFEADGQRYNAGSFIIRTRNGDEGQLEAAAKELGITVHATNADLKVPTHALAAPRIAIVHGWQSTQNDGWFRIAFDQTGVPYTYIADTKLRETPAQGNDLRSQFDVIVLPPMGGFGGNAFNSIIRGLPMRGAPMPWKNTAEMPNLVAPGLDTSDDIRGGLGFSGLTNLEKFVSDGGLLVAVQSSASLPINGGMTEMVSMPEMRGLEAPGSVVLADIEDKKSPITYGYGDKLYVYFHDGPVFHVGTSFQQPGAAALGEGPGARASGRGSLTDPDVIQARQYVAPEKPPKRSKAEQELYIPDEIMQYERWRLPPAEEFPRVVLRFAPEKELLLSGMMVNANEVAESPAVIDQQHGKGHVVLFANNPMWRNETGGSFFLLFNAVLNYDHLSVGHQLPNTPAAPAKPAGGN